MRRRQRVWIAHGLQLEDTSNRRLDIPELRFESLLLFVTQTASSESVSNPAMLPTCPLSSPAAPNAKTGLFDNANPAATCRNGLSHEWRITRMNQQVDPRHARIADEMPGKQVRKDTDSVGELKCLSVGAPNPDPHDLSCPPIFPASPLTIS